MNRIIQVGLLSMSLLFFPALGKGEEIMRLMSMAFQNNSAIPAKYTCQGEDINPELRILGVPESAKSIVLIMDDPDAPGGMWVHWVVYNIPVELFPLPDTYAVIIAENSIPGEQGSNDFGREDYGGPCPPSGTHHYFFKAYALDTTLQFVKTPNKKDVETAMQGHILAKAEIVGLYSKKR